MISFARHQFSPAIIRHAVWLYARFTLSYRDVEDLLAERGLDVSYETVRRWVLRFGPLFARELRRRRPRPTAKWHLDEMAVIIGGRRGKPQLPKANADFFRTGPRGPGARGPMRHHKRPTRVLISGGSIAGLCAGIALRGIGHDVDVYERAAGPMASRGAGIVVQDDLLRLLRRYNIREPLTVACSRRRYLVPDGGEGITIASAERFTSWSAIYHTLRSSFPGERYHLGSTVKGFEQDAQGVVARFVERADAEADLLVCADGSFSEMRLRLLPEVRPQYAGYIAWRGALDEEAAPPELTRFFDQSLTFCGARSGGHILCYFIPGRDVSAEQDRRQLNWVWYVKVNRSGIAGGHIV